MFHASALLSPYFSQITFFIEEDQITKNKKIVIHEEDFDRKNKIVHSLPKFFLVIYTNMILID